MIKELLPYFKPYKKQVFLAVLAIIIEVVCEVVQPVMMAEIIDYGIPTQNLNFILQQGLTMVFLSTVSLAAGVFGARYASMTGVGIANDLREAEMAKIQQFSFQNIDHFSNASLVTRLTSDVTSIQNTTILALRILARAPIMIIVTVVMAISVNAQLSLVLLLAIPVLALAISLITTVAFPRFDKLQKAVDDINRTLQENFIGIRVVKSFVREDLEREKFNDANNRFKNRAIHAIRVIIWNTPVMQLTIYTCTIAIMWFGGNMTINNVMTTGNLITFLSYIAQILMSLMMIGFVFVMVTISKASLGRILEVLNTHIDITEKQETINHLNDGSIVFERVHFSYGDAPTEEVLSDINFTLESGQTLGIIGPTGSGKTSLVQLIPRLFDVKSGRVLVGGENVKSYAFDTLRQQVAMVLQKNTLFSGTIRENLLWGNTDASDEDLIRAAKQAQAHDFIMELPDGYNAIVEQGGSNFSGGQKQRLCIARALVRKPAVLILDDSTSAVDTATDTRIREAFFKDMKGTTIIIIAQRISSIQGADHILVLQDGKTSGFGTHDQLLENNTLYRDIYETQVKGADNE